MILAALILLALVAACLSIRYHRVPGPTIHSVDMEHVDDGAAYVLPESWDEDTLGQELAKADHYMTAQAAAQEAERNMRQTISLMNLAVSL